MFDEKAFANIIQVAMYGGSHYLKLASYKHSKINVYEIRCVAICNFVYALTHTACAYNDCI